MPLAHGSPAAPALVTLDCARHEALRIRVIAIASLGEARSRSWPFLSDVLERSLRGVPEEDRAIVTSVVHALVRYDRLLDFASEGGDAAAHFDALVTLACGHDPRLTERIERIERPSERLGVVYSFPDWIVDLVREDAGDEALERALARMNERAPRVVRVNVLKTTREACLASLAEGGVAARPTAHAPYGIAIDGRRSVFRTAAFARGDFEVQDEASQMVAELVAPPPRSLVVDACAGAGGKALALAAILGGRGRIVAIDVAGKKLDELRRRARRAGASNVQAIGADLLAESEALNTLAASAARVLVDAPCTGLGAIRRNPEVRWRLRPEEVESIGRAQAALLRAAAKLVAPRGRLIYATCSFLRREGEDLLDRFFAQDPTFSLVSARDVLGRAKSEAIATKDGRYLRTWRLDGAPDGGDAGMDGFFAGVARRAGGARERA
ncbi:MAG: RsmB/NOP family class I SAM-dependent RNA methyltransferase [Polyangiaceae bacterium]